MRRMASHRTHTKTTGAPDYDSPQFWDARFAAGQDVGEWLNSGEALIDTFVADLEGRRPSLSGDHPPRTLHLGPGVSMLGFKLQEIYHQRRWKSCHILVCFPLIPNSALGPGFHRTNEDTSIEWMYLSALQVQHTPTACTSWN